MAKNFPNSVNLKQFKKLRGPPDRINLKKSMLRHKTSEKFWKLKRPKINKNQQQQQKQTNKKPMKTAREK